MPVFTKPVILEVRVITLCQEMVQVMERGGFNLTKFKNNSDRVLKALQNQKYKKQLKT